MANYDVKIIFNDGSGNYQLPVVQSENGSNLSGTKDTIIEGNRGDGAIVIPSGKKSQIITIRGILMGADYKAITTLMNTMRTNITTDVATLKMTHQDSGEVVDWTYTVKRITEIEFPENLRISSQEYIVNFLILEY